MRTVFVLPAPRRLLLVGWAVISLVADPALACSVCQCGDYTLNLMGADKPFAGRLRAAVDYSVRTESQGVPGDDERLTHERRTTLGLSYAFGDRLALALRLPYVDKQYRDTDGTGAHGTGLGDIDLAARLVLSDTTVPARQLYGVQGGLRLPTGQQVRQAGERIDIDGQPGAGATVPSLGGFYGWFRFPALVYLSVQASPDARGNQGFRQGAAVVATATGQYALNTAVSLQLALESRWTGQNVDGGERDGDSGGAIAYLTPGLLVRLGDEWIASVSGQLPVLQRLNGHQRDDGEFRLGLTYDLPNWWRAH